MNVEFNLMERVPWFLTIVSCGLKVFTLFEQKFY